MFLFLQTLTLGLMRSDYFDNGRKILQVEMNTIARLEGFTTSIFQGHKANKKNFFQLQVHLRASRHSSDISIGRDLFRFYLLTPNQNIRHHLHFVLFSVFILYLIID